MRRTDMLTTDSAADIIRALIKAKKNLRLYPDNNPIYIKIVDDMHSLMSSILEHEESMIFRIKQYEIIYCDEIVYQNKDKDDSLSLFFFKDGIREITFNKGITREELEEFLRIVSLDYEKDVTDDDIVTLLWERDFKYIQYIVDDAFLLEDENYERSAIQQVKGACGGSREIMKAYSDAFHGDMVTRVDIVPITNDDINSIMRDVDHNSLDKTHILMHSLFEMVSLAYEPNEYDLILSSMRETVNYAVANANMRVITYAFSKLNTDIAEEKHPEKISACLKAFAAYMNSGPFIKLFCETIRSGAEIPGELIYEFSSHLGAASIPHLLAGLGEAENMSARRTFINILTEVGRKDILLVARGLSDQRWYVVRNVIYILRKIADRASLDFIVRAAGHPDKRVRKEVVHAVGEMGSEKELKVLGKCIFDEMKPVRIAALIAIGRIGTAASREMITRHIESRHFRDKDLSEKKEIMNVLSRWKDRDVIEFLVKIVKKKFIFNRAKNNESIAAAIYGLGLVGIDDVRSLIEKFEHSKNRVIRTHALQALKKA